MRATISSQRPVIVVGGGIGGLSAALLLAAQGVEVIIMERAATIGGKLRQVSIGAAQIDSGPTVFTLKRIFEEIFAEAGANFDSAVPTRRASILARHAFDEASRLDLHADAEASAEAIGVFAGAEEARGFLAFCAEARRTWTTLEHSFVRRPAPSMAGLIGHAGLTGIGDLMAIRPFATLWSALGDHFKHQRLRQLFGRYATYCGSSPFQAPATLMLVAHVEQDGVFLIEGGMIRLVEAMADLAKAKGATIRTGAEVVHISTDSAGVSGVMLASGERIEASAVVFNGDVSALGALGVDTLPKTRPNQRSLSALTWSVAAKTIGFPLHRHTVFFSRDYPAEFNALQTGRMPDDPTIYICAQDRGDHDAAIDGPERLFCLINAPATGDIHSYPTEEIDRCAQQVSQSLKRCGLTLDLCEALAQGKAKATTPADFARMFPGTGGALYGRASHGWAASFQRPGLKTKTPGLYLAGGSAHPGPGIPMAALSGAMAARRLLADRSKASSRSSIARSQRTAMPGGMSTR